MKDSLLYKEPVEPAHWVGLRKSNDLLDYLRVRKPSSTELILWGGNTTLCRTYLKVEACSLVGMSHGLKAQKQTARKVVLQ